MAMTHLYAVQFFSCTSTKPQACPCIVRPFFIDADRGGKNHPNPSPPVREEDSVTPLSFVSRMIRYLGSCYTADVSEKDGKPRPL